MAPEIRGRFITAAVVPVVGISACGFLCLALYNRQATVVTRVRTFLREILQQEAARGSAPATERHREMVQMLELQTKRLIARANQIRRGLICLLAAIGTLISSALLAGAGVLVPVALYLAGSLFIAGMLLALTGVSFAIAELRGSLEPVTLEAQFVDRWIGAPGDR